MDKLRLPVKPDGPIILFRRDIAGTAACARPSCSRSVLPAFRLALMAISVATACA